VFIWNNNREEPPPHPPGVVLIRAERNHMLNRYVMGDEHVRTDAVGRCTLTPPDPWLKGAWFQPCTYQVKNWFQSLLSYSTCTATTRCSPSTTTCSSRAACSRAC
jgi:hypothetical protein